MSAAGGAINAEFDDQSGYDSSTNRYPPDWDARRSAVQKRDDWTCQDCGVKSGPHAGDDGVVLDVHHQTPLSEGGSNRFSNLITLCVDCHNNRHEHDITAGRDDIAHKPGLNDRLIGLFRWVLGGVLVFAGHTLAGMVLLNYPIGSGLWGVGVGAILLMTVGVLVRPGVVARVYTVAAIISGAILYTNLAATIEIDGFGGIIGTTAMPVVLAVCWWWYRR